MHRFCFLPPRGCSPFSLVTAVLVAACGLLLAGSAPVVHAQSSGTVLPARFEANRIYVTPVTAAGDTLRLYTDTGGGRYPILTKPAVERLGLSPTDTLSRGRRSLPVVSFPDVEGIPAPTPDRAVVFPNRGQARLLDVGDGMLGQGWFAGGIWTFDYGAERLVHHPSREGLSFAPRHTVDLAFQTDSTGRRTGHHPRMQATIAGEQHDFLLDTGATSVLADSARGAVGGATRIGSGFVIASVFDQWRRNHPDWTVLKGGSVFRGGTPLIRVPEVTVAGHTVGPVWFERRPDRAFKKRMARTMDQPVDGALGGSLFRHFRVTVDYPEARARFERLAD